MTASQADEVDVNGPSPDLKRVMGPKLLLLFIVGDILGAGIYAVTGEMAREVGGIVWLPFLVAFAVATLTALSYLELVDEVPAGGRRGALHAQGVRHPLRHVPGRVRGDLLGHHQRLDLVQRAGARTSPAAWSPTAGSTPSRAPA